MTSLITLVYAIALAQSTANKPPTVGVPTIKLCDLLKDPQLYDGLTVAVEGYWEIGPEGSVLVSSPGSCGSQIESRSFWEKQISVQLPKGDQLAASSQKTKELVVLHDETLRYPTRQVRTRVAMKGKVFVYKKFMKSKRGDPEFGYLATWPFVLFVDWMLET